MPISLTDGWDVVYAVRLSKINEQLLKLPDAAPVYETTVGDAHVEMQAGRWRLIPGGSGNLVFLELSISGSFRDSAGVATPYAGSVIMEVQLQFLQHMDGAPGQNALTIRFTVEATQAEANWFSIRQVILGSAPAPHAEAFVRAVVAQWLLANTSWFSYVFGVVDASPVTDDAQYAWLRPTFVSYAYCNCLSDEDCFLAILCMTQGRDPSGLKQQVSPSVIKTASDAAFVVSPHLLIDDIILNALPKIFPGTVRDDYSLNDDLPGLSLKAPKQLLPVVHDGKSYDPILETLDVAFREDRLELSAHFHTSIFDGVTAHSTIRSSYGVSVKTREDGSRALQFNELAPPDVEHWHQTDPAIDKIQTALGIAALVGVVVAEVVTLGMVSIVFAIGSAVLGILLIEGPSLIAAFSSAECPTIDLMASNMLAPFTWTGGGKFHVDFVDLDQSLRFSGSPWP